MSTHNFMYQQAPSGQPWAAYCRGEAPTLDRNGLVQGHWGEAMHYAVEEECKPGGWEGRFADGPAGQLIDFLVIQGHDRFAANIGKNEERTKEKIQRGDHSFAFEAVHPVHAAPVGGVVQGQIIPNHPGAPGSGPVVVGIPILERFEQEHSAGRIMKPGYSESQCRSGAAILDNNPMMPETRKYKDVPFAVCFGIVVLGVIAVAAAFGNEIALLVERAGTQWESFPETLCGMRDNQLTTWPEVGGDTMASDRYQRLSEPTKSTRLLSELGQPPLEEGPVILLPGLSGFVRRLEIAGFADPNAVAFFGALEDLDLDDEADDEAEERRLVISSSRRRTASKKAAAPTDSDCERACAAFEECGAFEVRQYGTGTWGAGLTSMCTFYEDVGGNYPTLVNRAGESVACWRKVDAQALSSSSKRILGSLFGMTFLAAAVSMICAVAFVKCAQVSPATATYVGVYFGPACLIAIGLILLVIVFPIVGGLALIVGLFCLCMGGCMLTCMCWCYKPLIPLTIQVVGAVTNIIMRHTSLFAISLCGSLLGILWSFACCLASIGVAAYMNRQQVLVPAHQIKAQADYVTYPQYFLECLIYFWGAYTVVNVCHTTYCGVFGRWYFGLAESVSQSLKVATTYSFGSVCMGSFIIAFIRALEQLAKKMKRDAQSEGNITGCVIGCILQCIIGCIGDILEWISMYVYVQVAIRGLGFVDGCRATYALATMTNLIYVVACILVDWVAGLGALVCAMTGAVVAGLVGYYTCGIPGACLYLALLCGVFGCCGGMMAGGTAVGIMNSGAQSVLMCWAERPDTLEKTNPEIANRFQEAINKVSVS